MRPSQALGNSWIVHPKLLGNPVLPVSSAGVLWQEVDEAVLVVAAFAHRQVLAEVCGRGSMLDWSRFGKFCMTSLLSLSF